MPADEIVKDGVAGEGADTALTTDAGVDNDAPPLKDAIEHEGDVEGAARETAADDKPDLIEEFERLRQTVERSTLPAQNPAIAQADANMRGAANHATRLQEYLDSDAFMDLKPSQQELRKEEWRAARDAARYWQREKGMAEEQERLVTVGSRFSAATREIVAAIPELAGREEAVTTYLVEHPWLLQNAQAAMAEMRAAVKPAKRAGKTGAALVASAEKRAPASIAGSSRGSASAPEPRAGAGGGNSVAKDDRRIRELGLDPKAISAESRKRLLGAPASIDKALDAVLKNAQRGAQ